MCARRNDDDELPHLSEIRAAGREPGDGRLQGGRGHGGRLYAALLSGLGESVYRSHAPELYPAGPGQQHRPRQRATQRGHSRGPAQGSQAQLFPEPCLHSQRRHGQLRREPHELELPAASGRQLGDRRLRQDPQPQARRAGEQGAGRRLPSGRAVAHRVRRCHHLLRPRAPQPAARPHQEDIGDLERPGHLDGADEGGRLRQRGRSGAESCQLLQHHGLDTRP